MRYIVAVIRSYMEYSACPAISTGRGLREVCRVNAVQSHLDGTGGKLPAHQHHQESEHPSADEHTGVGPATEGSEHGSPPCDASRACAAQTQRGV